MTEKAMSRNAWTDKKMFVTPLFNFIFEISLHVIANSLFLKKQGPSNNSFQGFGHLFLSVLQKAGKGWRTLFFVF